MKYSGLCAAALAVLPGLAAASPLTLTVDHTAAGQTLPPQYASCIVTGPGKTGRGEDINPAISWSPGPAGTKSYAVFVEDPDSPAAHREWMNQPGHTLPYGLKRHIYFHWVLVNIPASVTAIAEGEVAHGLVAHGRPASASPVGTPGLNSFTIGMAANPAMKGDYYGYDGPCPPWNDATKQHHYHFKVYALSVAKLDLPPRFDGPAALAAMQGKILAQGELVALYGTAP